MTKDPAFLFYTSDFLTGTVFMTNEQVGIYIRLLAAQHQHGGLIDKSSFNYAVGNNDIVHKKFIETEDGFFNERLMKEIEKRSNKSKNLSANAKQRWEKHKEKQCKSNAIACDLHMPIEDVNEDVTVIEAIVNDLNVTCSTSYRSKAPKTRELIRVRLKEGYKFEDFKTVHRKKFEEWGLDQKMRAFLRPATLYSNKFENYLNQPERIRHLTENQRAAVEGMERLEKKWKEEDEQKDI